MSIVVTSNRPVEPKAETPKSDEVKEAHSAPEAKAPEQKESGESEPSETEEVENESDESEVTTDIDKPDESEKEKPKKKSGEQRRIDKITAQKYAAQREAEYWKQQALKGASESKPEPKVDSKPAPDGKPKPESFETHAEYVEALTDWKTDQKWKEHTEKQEKSKLQTEQEKVLKSHSERVNAFAEKTPDFRESLENLDDVQYSPAVQEIIVTSENGPELLYELAKDPEEAKRICSLSPLAAAREMGKIETRLAAKASEAKQSKETKKLTNAPKPINPVSNKAGTVEKSVFDKDLSQAEYEAIRRKQMKQRSASGW